MAEDRLIEIYAWVGDRSFEEPHHNRFWVFLGENIDMSVTVDGQVSVINQESQKVFSVRSLFRRLPDGVPDNDGWMRVYP